MPTRLGQFYAFVLLLACLATNVAFFAEVREPFFGDEDPLASVKSSFSELNIKKSITDFCAQVQSNVDGVTPSVLPKEEKPDPNEQYLKPVSSAKPERVTPTADSSPPSAPPSVSPPAPPPEPEPAKTARKEESKHTPSVAPPAETLQTAAAMPAPQPGTAKPVIADRFKPITAESKQMEPAKSAKPSPTPVWETVDTVLERPLRYD